ncbi:MAG TPA: universal stress protein [Terriglobia bacterium]|nr:universal stress protein [Terriglobia bacterium]
MSDSLVIVAVRDPDHVDDLVKLACQMAKGMAAELLVLNVVEVAPALPLDADAEILDRGGKDAIQRAAQVAWDAFGMKARTRLVRARDAGPTILDEAKEQNADLLVLGYHGRHGLGEILLGSCVQHVAAHAPCRVILQIVPAARKVAS